VTWRGEQTGYAPRGGNRSQGYYAGSPLNGGSGSGMGQAVAGAGTLASGQGVTIAGTTWHPTILYLGALVVAEMVVFAVIGNLLK
jgi:hypothetical protein